MSKTIETLVDDIYNLFSTSHTCDNDNLSVLSTGIASIIKERLSNRERSTHLRFSNIGTPCHRKLWYIVNSPSVAEHLPPNVKIKFLFGDILEELLLFLAKEAGHDVTGRQDTLELGGVQGHRDAIIDGRLIDVKSASSPSYQKFKSHGLRENDPFGYIDQLGAYLQASKNESTLRDKDQASFLVIDKQHGNICLDTYPAPEKDYEVEIEQLKEMVQRPTPPDRTFTDEPIGKSGNRGLGTVCSYCEFKQHCWPGIRTFIYSSGPEFLTTVCREPKVIEIDKDGNLMNKFTEISKEKIS